MVIHVWTLEMQRKHINCAVPDQTNLENGLRLGNVVQTSYGQFVEIVEIVCRMFEDMARLLTSGEIRPLGS